jgi:hypothetical protein
MTYTVPDKSPMASFRALAIVLVNRNGPPDIETLAGGVSTLRRDVGRRQSWQSVA